MCGGTQVDITFEDNPLPECHSFVYLGSRVPSCKEDLLRRKRLAWAALGKLRVVFESPAVPDDLRARLFSATVESVLLYNAVSWTMTRALEIELDAAHSHLLRVAFNIRWPERISNTDLYQRAGFRPPSERLREGRQRLAGEVIRSEASCPQPLQRLLLWQPTQPQRRGQGRRKTFPQILFEDCKAPDSLSAVAHVRRLALTHNI